MTPLITIKTSADAQRALRIVAALTGEKQYQVLERLLRAESERLGVPEQPSRAGDQP